MDTLEVVPLKKQYAHSTDHEWIPKINCSIKYMQCIISDGPYMASVHGRMCGCLEGVWLLHEKPALEAEKITVLYQRGCCPSAIHSSRT